MPIPQAEALQDNSVSAWLELNFREDSWVEITDGLGQKLFVDMGRAGRTKRLNGVLPFEILLGNAAAVDVTFAGEPVDLSRYEPGDVGRFHLPRGRSVARTPNAGEDKSASVSGKVVGPAAQHPPPASTDSTGAEPKSRNTVSNDPIAANKGAGNGSAAGVLELAFREDSWVEVHDGAGKRLFFDMGRAGSRIRLEGAEPFDILLGNANGVEVVFRSPVDLSNYGPGEVAHLRLPNEPEASDRVMAAPSALLRRARDPELWFAPPQANAKAFDSRNPEASDGHGFPSDLTRFISWTRRSEARDPDRWFEELPSDRSQRDQPDEPVEDVDPSERPYPRLFGESDLGIEFNTRFDAPDPEDEFEDWLSNFDSQILYYFRPDLFLASTVRVSLEGEDDGLHRFNTDFPTEGIYIRKLKLHKDAEKYSVFGGKYNPSSRIFGFAPIFFGNYATDLNLENSLGLGASYYFDRTETSEIRISAHAFTLDTTWLSGELISGDARNGTVWDDVGDTGRLNNYLITFNGGSIRWEPGLRYSAGFANRKGVQFGRLDEDSRFASAYYIHRLDNGSDLNFSIDLLAKENAGGYNEDTESVTVGTGYSSWPTFAGIAYSERQVFPGYDAPNSTGRIIELVGRKGLAEQLFAEGALQWIEEGGEISRAFGIAIIYYFDWQAF